MAPVSVIKNKMFKSGLHLAFVVLNTQKKKKPVFVCVCMNLRGSGGGDVNTVSTHRGWKPTQSIP